MWVEDEKECDIRHVALGDADGVVQGGGLLEGVRKAATLLLVWGLDTHTKACASAYDSALCTFIRA